MDFYSPTQQLQPAPDMLASYLRGSMAPGVQTQQQQSIAGGQQELEKGGLQLEQLRMALQNQRAFQQYGMSMLPGSQANGAQATGGASGGIQTGPQGAVSSQPGNPYEPSSYAIPQQPQPMMDPRLAPVIGMLGGNSLLEGASKGYQLQQEAYAAKLKTAQLQAQGPLTLAKTVAQSPNADRIVFQNPSILEQWQKIAPTMGLDPLKDLTPQNAQRVAALAHDNLASQLGLPTMGQPEHWTQSNVGYGGTQQIKDATGETKPGLPREIPTATQEKVYDPASGHEVLRGIPTGGMSAGGQPLALGGSGAAPVGAPNPRDLGAAKPDDAQNKAANFAGYFRGAAPTLDRMEKAGFTLPPTSRAAIINAATSEDTGAIHSVAQQEILKHGLGKDGQEYMAALMPVLQAAGHSMGGARLTAGQMRTNFESLIPISSNPAALQQIQTNRQSYYKGLLQQAGPAVWAPEYKDTLGADRAKLQGTSAHPANIQALLDQYGKK